MRIEITHCLLVCNLSMGDKGRIPLATTLSIVGLKIYCALRLKTNNSVIFRACMKRNSCARSNIFEKNVNALLSSIGSRLRDEMVVALIDTIKSATTPSEQLRAKKYY